MATVMNRGNGRNELGQFAHGNTAGKGSPVAKRMYYLRATLLSAVEPERIKRVAAKLQELAEAGDVPAARLLLEYAAGKPVQAVEVSGPDGAPVGVSWERVQGILLQALGGHPEARAALAEALRGVADDARTAR
jgi:hypothetical protein